MQFSFLCYNEIRFDVKRRVKAIRFFTVKREEGAQVDAKLLEAFAAMPWWGYALGALAGVGFGALQVWLLKLSIAPPKPRIGLFITKFVLWLIALVVWVLLSPPLLIAFVIAASITQFAGAGVSYQKARKEAE
ncbi:MAG: hypothetical protein RR946_00290 [Clostridia bacterium]